MDKIEELLPGIEEFLTKTLESEPLTPLAEERRQFFIERLDIVKLPPTVPPREGRKLSPELLKETEENSGIPVSHSAPDFAATQREISRSFVEHPDDGAVSDTVSEKEVKVYDDIDPTESSKEEERVRPRSVSEIIRPSKNSDDEDDDKDEDENDLYEIPVARQQLSTEDTSLSYGADASSLATTGSTEELPDDVLDSITMPPPPVPPPLPPRRDIKFSDSGSKSSLNEDTKPPELPFRPPLPKRNELYAPRSEKSDGSERGDIELSGDGDSTSYESFEEDNDQQDNDLMNKLDVKLPKKPKKKTTLKKSKKLSKSRSSSQWEINVPFKKLDNVDISGELFHRGKLSWNRRIVAISNGSLAMYKPDKDARPSLVIPLTGYEATVIEKEGARKGFEVKMTHPNDDTHTFSVDFRDWANLWMEHINGTAKGQTPAKYHTHLARSFSGGTEYTPPAFGSKTDLTGSNSNLSTGSEGASEESSKTKLRGNKVMRMGSFAFRATQFFENIGKKTTGKRKHTQSLNPAMLSRSSGDFEEACNGIMEESSVSSNSAGNLQNLSVLTPTSDKSLPPVFSDANSSSLPSTPVTDLDSPLYPMVGFQMEEDDSFSDAAHKGYLSIFSSFNKRRWGKRWCLVRENMFECYRSERSKQCELNFLLKPCVLRRAIEETNSERGLMIMEDGKEKITVEPLSENEMGPWVRILILETCTEEVPEGLEDYMKEPEPDTSSLMSFTVLKQWDMGNLVGAGKSSSSSHDYEDPKDTTLAAKELDSPANAREFEMDSDNTELESSSADSVNPNDSADSTLVQTVLVPEDAEKTLVEGAHQGRNTRFLKISDNLAAYNKNKHTTDSGFYSVKGANSDSDSGCENVNPSVGELDCGYDTLDSRSYRNSKHAKSGSACPASDKTAFPGKNSSETGDRKGPSCDSCIGSSKSGTASDSNSVDGSPNHTNSSPSVSLSSSQCVQASHSSSSSGMPQTGQSVSQLSPTSVQSMASEYRSKVSTSLQGDTGHYESLTLPTDSVTDPQPLHESNKRTHSTSSHNKSSSAVSSNNSVISPSEEEYSIVLTKSERSKPYDSSVVESRTCLKDGELTKSENTEECVLQENEDLTKFGDKGMATVMSSRDESYYEPVGKANIADDSAQNNPVNSGDPSLGQPEELSEPNSNDKIKLHSHGSPDSISSKLEHNRSTESSSAGFTEPIESTSIHSLNVLHSSSHGNDSPPPLPSSPVPDSKDSSEQEDKGETASSRTPHFKDSSQIPSPTLGSQLESSEDQCSSASSDNLSSSNLPSKAKSKKPTPIKTSVCNGEETTSQAASLSPDDAFSKTDRPVSPMTPTSDSVQALVENPNTTPDELKHLITRLKDKQSQIKRKRMAVHDKRQRVLSDEERLACEKEFAALERVGESTELDIRGLQNQLDILQGQTLEAMKAAQGKRKPGSKKKKNKRKF